MKKVNLLLFLFTITFSLYSQNDQDLQFKLDSIIAEADLMYKYEKVVWNSSDLLFEDENRKSNYGGYVVSDVDDTIFVTHINRERNGSVARYTYLSRELESPIQKSVESSPLTTAEKELLDIKLNILSQLSDTNYELSVPDGYNPNFVLMRNSTGYNMYVLIGTFEHGVIPFGNDYLFRTDETGKINSWKKFHSRLIPVRSHGPQGAKVVSASHSHLKETPYITATDICTFRLYGELYGMNKFQVLCLATESFYTYKLKENKIEVEKL